MLLMASSLLIFGKARGESGESLGRIAFVALLIHVYEAVSCSAFRMTCAGCVRAPLAQAIHFLREVALFAAFGIVQLHYYLGSKKPFRKVPGPFHQLPFIAYYPSIMKKRVAYQGIKGSWYEGRGSPRLQSTASYPKVHRYLAGYL